MKCDLLYLVGQLGPGGLERQLYYLLQTINRKCYQPAVAVWNDCENDVYTPQIRALGVPVYSFPRTFSPPAKLVALRRLIRELHPAVAHSYSFYTNFAVYWATKGTPTVAVGSVRGEFARAKKESGRWLGRLSARWPCEQICNNSFALEVQGVREDFLSPAGCRLSVMGLTLTDFILRHCLSVEEFALSVWDLSFPSNVGIAVIRAALTLKQRGFNFLVRLVGDGPLRDSLRQQTQTLGVAIVLNSWETGTIFRIYWPKRHSLSILLTVRGVLTL